jgi:glycerol-3-phosphate acyltransferase PlsY
MGATNVLRTLGKGPALLVLITDACKGIAAVNMVRLLQISPWQVEGTTSLDGGSLVTWMVVVAGLGAVVGHSRPLWLRFKGGKSVATGLGILLAMSWPVALIDLGIWLLSLGFSRRVSLSSLLAAAATPVLMFNLRQPLAYGLFALAAGLYVVLTHRRNIERLLAGTEPLIGQKLTTPSPSPASVDSDSTGVADQTAS